MKKVNRLAACGLLTVTMAASVLTGCGDQKLDGNETALVIDGEEVSLGLANYFLRTDQAHTYAQMQGMMQYISGGGNSFWSTEIEDGVTYAESFKQSEVDNLTNLLTLRKHAEEYGVSITPEDQKKIEEASKAFYDKNEETLVKMGVQVGNVEEGLELKTIEVRMKAPMTADIDREVSDEEAAQSTCTYVRLRKPDDAAEVETAKKSMEDILDQILALPDKETADLKELAQSVNEDTYGAQYNYNQGAFDDENNVLDEVVRDVLPSLKEGEVYNKVLEGESYFFIIRMDKMFDREKTDQKKETIISERETEAYNTMLEGWTADVTAETKSCWDKLEVSDSEVITVAQ